ncbi:Uncharacterized protein slp1 [Ceratocystis fimbriata CBS 114723]|uniref:Uncharacterized protein slp1 n=1 Tax=Ceratocystis fimbriata CBS 114723 TaxID=1035309 RepID=A0A2C5WU29_9PEZI|nr:Uncharacterized protein slp1 [Ceratocystis fimbriata CBS 114723]
MSLLQPRILLVLALFVKAFFVHATRLTSFNAFTCNTWVYDEHYFESLQQCPKTEPLSRPSFQESPYSHSPINDADTHDITQERPSDGATTQAEAFEESKPFPSFEEWKEIMMRKRENADTNLGEYHSDIISGWSSMVDKFHLSEDSRPAVKGSSPLSTITSQSESRSQSTTSATSTVTDEVKLVYHPSKDAGKTCKERFSYASFDSGATVLKTTPGAKNAKAILRENKDSYLLLECAIKNKFVIIELSDDILVDTVVIANFEFFSSMVRRFRVSASDRFPVKSEKWVDLGSFEARNSRDIQAFLVENPRIYARYIRIEFLSHYGTEYYCPISLVRIHGTTMIESWKETEAIADESSMADDVDESGDNEPEIEIPPPQELPQESNSMVDRVSSEQQELEATNNLAYNRETSSDDDCFHIVENSNQCSNMASPSNIFHPSQVLQCVKQNTPTSSVTVVDVTVSSVTLSPTTASTLMISQGFAPDPSSQVVNIAGSPHSYRTSSETGPPLSIVSMAAEEPIVTSTLLDTMAELTTNDISSTSTKSIESIPPRHKPPASSPSPVVQESFFKSVSKRLQYLETNITWSIRYLEGQSYYIQDILSKADQQQKAKLDTFMGNLNNTILEEIRTLRFQYEQIWELAAASLESQRLQSEKEIVALGSRLNVLAEEVVFQKRMSIGQSVLLLSCLVLVIFSRSVIASPMEWVQPPQNHGQRQRNLSIRKTSSRGYTITGKPSLPESYFADPLDNWEEEECNGTGGVEPQPSGKGGRPSSGHQQESPPESEESSSGDEVAGPLSEHEHGVVNAPLQMAHRASLNMISEVVRKPLPALPEHPDQD